MTCIKFIIIKLYIAYDISNNKIFNNVNPYDNINQDEI